MNRIFNITAACLCACLFLTSSLQAKQTEVYLNISKQFNPKIKILVPPFQGRASEETLRKILLQDLTFSSVLVPIHEGGMIAEAEQTDRSTGRIQFANWGRFGAEAILKVENFSTAGQSSFQAVAYSMQSQSRVFAKKYSAPAVGQRRLVHAMVNDLIEALTGTEGIALSKIAFISDATGAKELYSMDYDGSNVRRLSSDRSLMLYPHWSPDGKEIVALSYLRGKPNLCRIDVAASTRNFIAAFPGLNTGGAYSPDGKSLALTLSKDGNLEIYRMNLADRSIRRLTNDRALDSSPTWSPDGSQIAFVSDRSGSPQIYVMNADGTGQRRTSNHGGYNTSPAWSPKGNFIAYCTLIGKNFQIFVLDPESGTASQITDNRNSNEDPSWAPDGRHLAYSSTANYQSDIFMIDIYDQHPIQLTHRLGSCVSPSWSHNFSRSR